MSTLHTVTHSVSLGIMLVVVVLGWSVYEVKYRRRYQLHKRVQLTLAAVLLLTVVLFEIDVRYHGWQDRAAGELGGHPAPIVPDERQSGSLGLAQPRKPRRRDAKIGGRGAA